MANALGLTTPLMSQETADKLAELIIKYPIQQDSTLIRCGWLLARGYTEAEVLKYVEMLGELSAEGM